MTHAHIPTLPQIRRPQIRRPKHRRNINPDALPTAPCSGCVDRGTYMITRSFCPRHEPTAYAMHMARHATDSL